MTTKKDFRNQPEAWADGDEQYRDRMAAMDSTLKERAKAGKKEVKEAAKEAKGEVKEAAKAMKREAKDELERVKDRERTYGESVDAELARAKAMNKEVKGEIGDESARVRERIDERAGRFEDGIDKIARDLTTENGRRNTVTSGMDSHGNYMAADRRGTVNNYIEQFDEHVESTKERIREDVRRGDRAMQEKEEKIDR